MNALVAKVCILCVPIVTIGWLTVRDLAPGGEFTVVHTVVDRSPYVNRILPDERVSVNNDVATLVDEPVYFSVLPPAGDFERVTVNLQFNPHEQPIVELGGLTDVRAYAFDFRPLSNAILEKDDWYTTNGSGKEDVETVTQLFSKVAVNATLNDFLAHAPARSVVATYRATFPTEYRMNDYVPLGSTQRFDVTLRGAHEFLTYLKDETLSFDFMYTDVNRTYGADEGAIRVWNEEGEVVFEKQIVDDGNVSLDQRFSERKTVTVRAAGLAEGVYRIEMSGTSDIFWRTLTTSQRYVTFKNKLYIGDDVGFSATPSATEFVTNSQHITFETFHSDSPQLITIAGETITIPEAHEKVIHDVDRAGIVSGSTPAGDVKMVGEAKFALSKESFFDPDPIPLTPFTALDDVTYVYATTAPVRMEGDWRSASATFEMGTLAREGEALKFAISAPGLAQLGTTVDVHKIQLTFRKEPMTVRDMIREFARRWVRALREI